MSSVEVEYALTVNTEAAEINVRKLETGLIRLGSQIRRLTGNESINSVIFEAEKATYAARSIQQAITSTSIALAGAGPVGWLIMGTSLISAGFATVDFMTQSQMG